jgi:hypothetical protein
MKTAFGLLLMWGGVTSEFLSFGLSTVGSVAVGAAGVVETTVGLKKIYDAILNDEKKGDKKSSYNELKDLYNCVFG